jgi:CRISPR-associated protein Cas5d
MTAPVVSLKVWGDEACFTRPELKVERLSYQVMTPSAARGVLEAILWKPQFYWHVRRITALHPPGAPVDPQRPLYQLQGVRRNEIQDKLAPRTVEGWIAKPESFSPYLVDSAGRTGAAGECRTQRNTMLLRDVCYRIDASIFLTSKANTARQRPPGEDEEPGEDTVAKYVSMFNRRVAKGQAFHRPYLGCREFAAHFAPLDGSERTIEQNLAIGLMLYDLKYSRDGNLPGFFQAEVKQGVLHCDTLGPGPNREPPVTVLGWPQEDAA